jgi:O-antigen ligase
MPVAERERRAAPAPRAPTPRAALSWALAAFAFVAPLSIAGLNAAAAAVTLLLLACVCSGDGAPWNAALTPFSAALAAYFAVAVVVSALGVDPSVSFGQLHKDFHKLWLLWLLLVALRLAGTRSLARALGWGCAVASVYGIGQALLLRTAGGTALVRAHAFVHPLIYGEIVGLCWLGALALWLSPARDSPSRRALLIFLSLSGAALLLSQSRGALLGTAAGAAVLGLADKRYRRISALALVAVPAAAGFWELLPSNHNIAATLERLRHHGPNSSADLARLTFWRVGLQIFRDHPWFGVGLGNYRTVFDRYFQGVFDGERVWGSAHNLYIHQAAERGLLGLAALAGVLWTMTARAWRRARLSGSAADLWALAACAAFLVMNLTEVAFQTEQVASLMIFIWAYAEARHGADAHP